MGTALSLNSHDRVNQLAKEGLLGFALPKEVGGLGHSMADWGQKLKWLGYENLDLSVPLLISLHASVALTLAMAKKPSWIERYVKPMINGHCFGSFAYTERSDIFSLKTELKRYGDKLCLNGSKEFVTGGLHADVFLVYAKDPDGDVRVVVVDKRLHGVRVSPVHAHGLFSARFAQLQFDNVVIAKEQMIDSIDGISHAQAFLNSRRVLLVAGVVGRMQAVLESLIEYGKITVRYGRYLNDMPNYQAGLGRLYGILRACDQILTSSLNRLASNVYDVYWDADISATKWSLTESAQDFGQQALRLAGGAGFLFEHPVACFHRDMAGLIAGGGAQEILEMDMGVRAIHIFERGKP